MHTLDAMIVSTQQMSACLTKVSDGFWTARERINIGNRRDHWVPFRESHLKWRKLGKIIMMKAIFQYNTCITGYYLGSSRRTRRARACSTDFN